MTEEEDKRFISEAKQRRDERVAKWKADAQVSAMMRETATTGDSPARDGSGGAGMTERTYTTQDKPTFTAPKWDIVRVTFDCPTTGRVQTLMRRNIETGEMLPHPAALGDSQPPRDGV